MAAGPGSRPSLVTIDRPLLEAVALLRSQGKPADDQAVARAVPNLSGEEVRRVALPARSRRAASRAE